VLLEVKSGREGNQMKATPELDKLFLEDTVDGVFEKRESAIIKSMSAREKAGWAKYKRECISNNVEPTAADFRDQHAIR
jgi:hypothetical protein